jgi:hypothetical protein
LTEIQRTLLLPTYILKKCDIIGTISKISGVSIRFNVTGNTETFNFDMTNKSIEDEVLPCLSSSGNVFFILDGQNQVLENINLITKEFYEKTKMLLIN